MLRQLSVSAKTTDALATICSGGASRITGPRLAWLEGLGLVENFGSTTYGITPIGRKFLEMLDTPESSAWTPP